MHAHRSAERTADLSRTVCGVGIGSASCWACQCLLGSGRTVTVMQLLMQRMAGTVVVVGMSYLVKPVLRCLAMVVSGLVKRFDHSWYLAFQETMLRAHSCLESQACTAKSVARHLR